MRELMDKRDREQELAAGVTAAHEELSGLLMEPTPKKGEAVDDVARRLLGEEGAFRPEVRKQVEKALDRYTAAVNAAWLHAENSGITGRCVAVWLTKARKDRAGLGGLDREDYSAEATFAMRRAVANYRANGGASLYAYAYPIVDKALRTLRGQALSAVELPGEVASRTFESNRGDFPAEYQAEVVDAE